MQKLPRALVELIKKQDGVVTRRQLMQHGLSRAQAIQRVRSRRWQRVHRGVFVTYTGPLSDRARVQAAILSAGAGATAAFETALWLAGFAAQLPAILQFYIPASRVTEARPGMRIFRQHNLLSLVQPGQEPARTRFEVTILDIADRTAKLEPVITIVLAAIQRRFTTAERLRTELERRSRHRHRALIREILADAEDGVASALERRYKRDVERPHGLPLGVRNRNRENALRKPYLDVGYLKWNTITELDGRAAHPGEFAFRDWHRDNFAAVVGDVVVRYGWVDVVVHPCLVAHQVWLVLRRNGFTGRFRRCPQCPPAQEFHDREVFAARAAANPSRS